MIVRKVAVSVILFVLCLCAARDMAEGLQAHSWPQTDGVVESIQVSDKTHDNSGRRVVDIVYRYTLDGVVYHGTRFNINRNGIDADDLAEVQKEFAPGTACRVAYNPRNPSRCYL